MTKKYVSNDLLIFSNAREKCINVTIVQRDNQSLEKAKTKYKIDSNNNNYKETKNKK